LIGIRVIKTAAAVIIAIYLAHFFHLTSPLSVGLFAVLGVDVTKKRGIKTSAIRIIASLVGLLSAALIFYLLGFHIWTIAVFILVVYSLLAQLKLQDGIVTSTVVMLHLFTLQLISFHTILNEVYLLLVGLGIATMINLIYMPDANPKMDQVKTRLEELFSRIFIEISYHLIDNENHIWDGKEILLANDTIKEGNRLAERSAENKLLQGNGYWVRYFEMRSHLLESTQRMLDLIAQVYRSVPHALQISQLFEHLSEEVKSEYYHGNVEKQLLLLEEEFKTYALPVTREEFEVRSALLQLCVELKNYLSIAKRNKKHKEAQG
jgi:uncharacterized membrane protein YgaE (UPF0421/DUF939 family)